MQISFQTNVLNSVAFKAPPTGFLAKIYRVLKGVTFIEEDDQFPNEVRKDPAGVPVASHDHLLLEKFVRHLLLKHAQKARQDWRLLKSF